MEVLGLLVLVVLSALSGGIGAFMYFQYIDHREKMIGAGLMGVAACGVALTALFTFVEAARVMLMAAE